jgi:RNA polymerase sigma-70 factor, ECF subfamily
MCSHSSHYPVTDPELIAALADCQQQDAWYEFERLYAPALLSTLRKRGVRAADADDCCQRIFTKLISAVNQFASDGQPAAFRRWLYRLARNETNSYLRQELRHRLSPADRQLFEEGLPDDRPRTAAASYAASYAALASQIEAEIEIEYRRQAFLEAAAIVQAEVNPVHWAAFWRTMVASQPTHVVATELGLSVGAIYVAKTRVLKRLQAAVSRWEETQ